MSYEKLSLAWRDFETNAPYTFQALWNSKDLTDVTLVTGDDQQIRAHKLILSSSSPFFRNIFIRNTHQNPLLYLKDITCKFLELVIQFIYVTVHVYNREIIYNNHDYI